MSQQTDPFSESVLKPGLLWSLAFVSLFMVGVAYFYWMDHPRSDDMFDPMFLNPVWLTTPVAWILHAPLGSQENPCLALCIGGVIQWTLVGFMIPAMERAWRRWLAA